MRVGNALGNLGNAYHSLGDFHKAIEYHDQALALSREIGDRQGEGSTLCNLGAPYHSLHKFDTAAEYFHQATLVFATLRTDGLTDQQHISIFREQSKAHNGLVRCLAADGRARRRCLRQRVAERWPWHISCGVGRLGWRSDHHWSGVRIARSS